MDFSTQEPQCSLVLGNFNQISHPQPEAYILMHTHKKYYANANKEVMGIDGTVVHGMGRELKVSTTVLFSLEDLGYMGKFAKKAAKAGKDLPPFYDATTGIFRGWVQHPYGISEVRFKVDPQGNFSTVHVLYAFYDKSVLDKGHIKRNAEIENFLYRKFGISEEARVYEVPMEALEKGIP